MEKRMSFDLALRVLQHLSYLIVFNSSIIMPVSFLGSIPLSILPYNFCLFLADRYKSVRSSLLGP